MIEIRLSVKPKSSSGQFGEIVSSGDSLFFVFPDSATGSREAARFGRGGSLVYNVDRFFQNYSEVSGLSR